MTSPALNEREIVTSDSVQRLIQIPQNVIDILDTNAQAHEVSTDARRGLLLRCELTVCGAGRMDGQTLGIAHVGHMAEQLQAVDEFITRFRAAFDAESQYRTRTFGKISLGALMIWVALQ